MNFLLTRFRCNEFGWYQTGAPEVFISGVFLGRFTHFSPGFAISCLPPGYNRVQRGSVHELTALNLAYLTFRQRQCPLLFPEAFSAPPVPTADVNLQYGGFDIEAERLFFAVANRELLIIYKIFSTDKRPIQAILGVKPRWEPDLLLILSARIPNLFPFRMDSIARI